MATAIQSAGSKSRAKLIAFGKHPGWDDHIEDIGLDDASLVTAKRRLYTEGLAGNIDSASWERLDESKRLSGFRHLFFWRMPQGWLVGRMWNSKDGKGRTKYPMTFAAMIEQAPAAWAVDQILPMLESLETKVTQTSSAEMVRFCAGEAKAKLDAVAATVTSGGGSDEQSLLARLVEHPLMDAEGKKQLGLARVFYEMERELGAFRRGTMLGRSKPTGAEAKSAHMRLPKVFSRPGDSSRAWVALLDREIDPQTPVLCFEPEGEEFVDVIIGEPGPSQLFCVKSSRSGIGLTTEVPYSLDEMFLGLARAKAEACKTPVGTTATPRNNTPASTKSGESSGKPWLKWLLGGGAAVIAVGVGVAVFGGGKPKDETKSLAMSDGKTAATEVNGDGTPAPPPPPVPVAIVDGSKATPAAKPPATVDAKPEAKPERKPEAKPVEPPKVEPKVEPEPEPKVDPVPQPAVDQEPDVPVDSGAPETFALGVYSAGDPRASWTVERDVARMRDEHARLSRERKTLGLPVSNAAIKELDSVISLANRLAKKEFTPQNKGVITAGIESIDQTLATARGAIDDGFAEVSATISKEIAATPSTVQNASLKKAWPSALARVPTNEGPEKARASVTALKTDFAALDAEATKMPRPAAPQQLSNPADWSAAVDTRMAAAIEAAAAKAADRDSAGAKAAIAGYNTWAAEASSFAKTVDEAAEALDRGAMPPKSPKESTFAADFPAVVAAIDGRAQTLTAAGTSNDPAQLLALITAPATSHEAVAKAWQRLGTLAWPTGPSELPRVVELSDGVVKEASTKLDAATKTGTAEADRVGAASTMWKRAASKVASAADVAIATSTLAPCGLTPEAFTELPASARYNTLVAGLAASVKAADPKSAVPKPTLDGFLQAVNALPASTAGQPAVASLLTDLQAAAAAPAAPDFASLGPGSKGWTAKVDGDSVTYSKGAQSIEFRKVASDGVDAMVSTTEVSVEQFGSALGDSSGKSIRDLMPSKSGEADRPGWGVIGWRWMSGGTGLRPGNAADQPGLGWIVEAPAGYYGGVSNPPKAPSLDIPMHRVSGGAAVAYAVSLGCRWPSAGEWAAAAAKDGGPANVFDADFAALEAAAKTRGDQVSPRSGSFQSKETPATPGASDGFLWFAPISHGAGPFKNTIGNVAEFVVSTREGAEALAARPLEELGKATSFANCGAIGGSALTAAAGPDQEMTKIRSTDFRLGFCDVGFRLAFTAGKSGPPPVTAGAVAAAIDKAGYLPPAQ